MASAWLITRFIGQGSDVPVARDQVMVVAEREGTTRMTCRTSGSDITATAAHSNAFLDTSKT
jgi:hypothetical protein